MPWSPERRVQHRIAMKRAAESNRCDACGRKSAIVWWNNIYFCRWIDEGKCDNRGNL